MVQHDVLDGLLRISRSELNSMINKISEAQGCADGGCGGVTSPIFMNLHESWLGSREFNVHWEV